MFVIEKLKLNKLEKRPIVSNRAMFKAVGEKPATVESKMTADCYSEPCVDGASKLKTLGLAQEIANAAYEKHITAGKSEDMTVKNARDY